MTTIYTASTQMLLFTGQVVGDLGLSPTLTGG